MTGSMIQFTEHVVSTRKWYCVDTTPVAMASPYESLEDVDWNIMIPATVKWTQTSNIVASFHETAEETQEARPATTFSDYIATLLQHTWRLLMHYEFTPGGERILKACLEWNMILKLGTNGSYIMGKEMASFGWLLIGNQNVLIRGVGPVDGVPMVLSSTRSELFGIAAPNEFRFHFMKFHQIESTSKCVKGVDNKAAIFQVNRTQHKHSRWWRYSNDVDIVTVIVDRMKESTLRHHLQWVKAHQDDDKPYKELDLWGRMNCDADNMA
jgi:hypothetical protein